MWTTSKARKHTKTPPQQLFCYMKHMQLPPAKADVFKETTKSSQVIAEECGQK